MKYMIEWESRDALEALLKELSAREARSPYRRSEEGTYMQAAPQVAEDRGLDPPPSLEEQARMASALATTRLPGTRWPARAALPLNRPICQGGLRGLLHQSHC